MPDHSFGGRFVLRKSTLICIIVIVCLAGRQSDRIEAGDAGAEQPDNRAEMIENLRQQNPPELEAGELWDNQDGPGLTLTTAHYEIFTTLLEPFMLRQSAGLIESAYKAYNLQLPEPIETTTEFTIYF